MIAVGSPQAAVDWEVVVRLFWLSVCWGNRTITLAQSGLLASGALGRLTDAEQEVSARVSKIPIVAKNFISNRLPFKA